MSGVLAGSRYSAYERGFVAKQNEAAASLGLGTLTKDEYEQGLKLTEIFMPLAFKRQREVFAKEPSQKYARLVHYTNADAALKIINSKRLWMRNTNCMTDYREVQHGYEIFRTFFGDRDKRENFRRALDSCADGIADEALTAFDKTFFDVQLNTYIASLSEHLDSEDAHGRLSMWRGFGDSGPRVAIVLKIPTTSGAGVACNLLFSPVAYLSPGAGEEVLLKVIENVNAQCAFLKTVSREVLGRHIFLMLLAGVTCLKHEGFIEEREWRAMYAPKRWPSPLMKSSIHTIFGVPQTVYEIPLDRAVSEEVADIDFAEMFDRLIVGPTAYPAPMFDPFVDALTNAGVIDAASRMFLSTIPIRT
jgi:hypothetical protein